MTDPTLSGTWAKCWTLLDRAARDPQDPARFAGLATLEGRTPALRTVALRAADSLAATVSVQTDRLSLKVPQIEANPNVALLVWDAAAQVQLRLNGRAELLQGTAKDWQAVPEPSREAYGHVPPPGTPIKASDAWAIAPDPARLTIIRVTLDHIDHVSLDPQGHRRAAFARADNWKGQWLSP